MKLLKGFALAWNMLTILPFFKVHTFFKGINGYSAMFYPLVGFILGSFLWAVSFLLHDYLPPIHLSVIIFTLWVVITGALHLDGFSDSVDGLFVHKDKALEVMKDSHVGGMGMSFTVVFLLVKLSSVIYLGMYELFYLLPVILLLSRLNTVLAIYFYPYASGGVGALIKKEFTKVHLLVSVFYSIILAFLFHTLDSLLITLPFLALTAFFFVKRLKGLSGDVYGFIIEVSELVLLNYCIVLYFS